MRPSARRATLEALCNLEASTLAETCLVAGLTKECVRQALAFLKSIGLVHMVPGRGVGSKRASRWSILPAGRDVLKDATWTGYERGRRARIVIGPTPRDLYNAYHKRHVERQLAMGLSREQIENEFDVRAYKGKGESEDEAA